MNATMVLVYSRQEVKMNKKVVLLIVIFLIASCCTLSAVFNYVDRGLAAASRIQERENRLAAALAYGQKDFRDIPYTTGPDQAVVFSADDTIFSPLCSVVYFNYPGLSEGKSDYPIWIDEFDAILKMRGTNTLEPQWIKVNSGALHGSLVYYSDGRGNKDVFYMPAILSAGYYYINGKCRVD